MNLNSNTFTVNGLLEAQTNSDTVTISNGTVQIGTNKELDLITTDGLTISANIVDSSACASTVVWSTVSAGSGTVTLSGTANTYSGGTYLNGGGTTATNYRWFVIGSASALGTGPVYVNGFLQWGANGTITLTTKAV